jgi:hypothetical protein
VQIEGARHNAAGHCPRCGRAITFKSTGKAGNLYDRATAQVIQRVGENELLVRIFKARKSYRRSYRDAKEEIWENARFFVRWETSGEISIEPYYFSYGKGITTHWHAGVRPVINHWTENFEADACGRLYLRRLGDTLAGTPWQYSQLQAFYEHDREPLETLPYLQRYMRYPFIEYLVKLGLFQLARHVVYQGNPSMLNFNGRSPHEILGVGMEELPLLQALDASPAQLKLLQVLRQQGICADERFLRWYAAHGTPSTENVLRPLRHMTPYKLMQYMDCQFAQLRDTKTQYGARRYTELRNVLSEYCDYLRIGADLGYDMKNTFVLFPRDLCAAHDTVAALFQAKKDAAIEQAIGTAFPALTKRYGYSRSGFIILAPKTAKEIVEEGHALRHCVGSYTERVAKEEQIILFLRRADNPAAPFVTLRLHGGVLLEQRGLRNSEPPPEARAFLKRWERDILLTQPQKLAA